MLLIILLQVSSTGVSWSGVVQVANYILLGYNILISIITSMIAIPTYKEHKLNTEFRKEALSPAALELRAIDKAKMEKLEKDVSDIKHNIININNQITSMFREMERQPDMEEVLSLLNKIKDRL